MRVSVRRFPSLTLLDGKKEPEISDGFAATQGAQARRHVLLGSQLTRAGSRPSNRVVVTEAAGKFQSPRSLLQSAVRLARSDRVNR
jgi:hypothetical protein